MRSTVVCSEIDALSIVNQSFCKYQESLEKYLNLIRFLQLIYRCGKLFLLSNQVWKNT